jgi:hypothetical protein
MARKRRGQKYANKGEKDIWHQRDLQNLRADRFVHVANQILKGRFTIVSLKSSPILQN